MSQHIDTTFLPWPAYGGQRSTLESSLHCMNILNQTQIVKIGSRYHLPIELFFATHVFKDHNNEEKNKICDSKFFITTGLYRHKRTQWQLISSSLIPAGRPLGVQGQTNLQSYF